MADARVSYRKARAWVRYDPARVTPERLVETINRNTSFRALPPKPQPPAPAAK